MVGSANEAEDIVQEAFLRMWRAIEDGTDVEVPRAYLAKITTRLAIDHLRSASTRRESYVGTWLPEPLVSEAEPDPAQHAELAESLSMAFLVVLESLAPVERAVFLLREVFRFSYPEIGDIVGKNEVNCRQIFARARRHVDAGRPRFEATAGQRQSLARAFFTAAERGDVEGLVRLLAADVAFHGDGGGRATAVRQPVHGRERVGRLVVGLLAWARQRDLRVRPVDVNGQPGAMFLDPQDRLVNVVCLDVAEGSVQAIRSVVNPDKLGHLGPVSDLGRVGRPR
ncbi:MAG: RNA polymerase sigma-70 factor [Actinomycetota bacterium]|nr:RNA polymerase sigma-70 factor [Actinomycetota bacterium]